MTTEKTLSHSERPGTLDLDWVQGGSFLSSPQPVGAQQGPGFAIQMLALGQEKSLDGQCSRGAHLGPAG